MEFILGFGIALVVGLTGVGGGTITAPVLILFLGLHSAEAVGTALIFGAVIKMFAVPVYVARRQVNFRVLKYLLAGGIPGALLGSLVFARLHSAKAEALVLSCIGVVVIVSAGMTLIRFLVRTEGTPTANRYMLVSACAAGIGAEVGFSSAGAGALGTIVLLQLTTLSAAEAVGTDLAFGLIIALLAGGLHVSQGSFQPGIAFRLICGGIAGVTVGAYLSGLVPKRALRVALSAFLMWMGVQLCLHGFASLGRG
jgi:uncharacterized membrane protein YfcA